MLTAGEIDEHAAGKPRVTCRNYERLGYERLARAIYGRRTPSDEVDPWLARRHEFLTTVQALMHAYRDRNIALYGPTALQILNVSLPTELEDWQTCHVVVPAGEYRPTRRGVVAHRTSLPLVTWGRPDGVPVLHPVEHWAQMAGVSDAAMVEIGDGLVRRQHPLLSHAEVRRHVAGMHAIGGIQQVRRAGQQIMSGTDSIYETRTRLVLTDAGLPCPSVNPGVRCASVGRTYHVDMGYVAEKIAVEYDGLVHVGDRRQMEIDTVRRRALQEAGWLIITATADQLRHPTEFIRSVEAALILRRASLPRDPSMTQRRARR